MNKILKGFAVVLFSLVIPFYAAAQTVCVKTIDRALSFDTADETIGYLEKEIPSVKTAFDKRILYCFMASVQEQAGLYQQAGASYAQAVAQSLTTEQINSFKIGVNARQSELIVYNLLKKTSSLLVLDAVRCSLNTGDYVTARKYLDSSIKNSKDEKIQATIKLYEVWSNLCAAQTDAELETIIMQLKAFCSLKELESVECSLLFTLWYVSADSSVADTLKKKYPYSAEAAVVSGSAQLMPTPFWFFVPRKGNSIAEMSDAKAAGSANLNSGNIEVAVKEEAPVKNDAKNSSQEKAEEKVVRQQLGFFSKEENAQALVQRVKSKGFNAYVEKETRPSGNVYYNVLVDENENGTIGAQLKTAGFECYPTYRK